MELTAINLPPSVTSVLEVKSSYDRNFKSLPSDYRLWNGPLHAKLLVFHEPTTLERTKHRSLTNSPQTELSKVEGTFRAETVARETYIHSSYSCHNSICVNPQWMSFSLFDCHPTFLRIASVVFPMLQALGSPTRWSTTLLPSWEEVYFVEADPDLVGKTDNARWDSIECDPKQLKMWLKVMVLREE